MIESKQLNFFEKLQGMAVRHRPTPQNEMSKRIEHF